MTKRFVARILLLVLSGRMVLPLFAAEIDSSISVEAQDKALKPYQVHPGPVDGSIAFLTARMLEEIHYLRQPFDEAVSVKFLDRYLEALDPQHLHFTQVDVAEFA